MRGVTRAREVPEPFREAAERALRAGWRITPTRSQHLLWVSPSGVRVVTASTPSCRRGNLNTLAQLRRAGL